MNRTLVAIIGIVIALIGAVVIVGNLMSDFRLLTGQVVTGTCNGGQFVCPSGTSVLCFSPGVRVGCLSNGAAVCFGVDGAITGIANCRTDTQYVHCCLQNRTGCLTRANRCDVNEIEFSDSPTCFAACRPQPSSEESSIGSSEAASSQGPGSVCIRGSSSSSGPRCGDGNVDTGEECDDGNTRGGDCCSTRCTVESRCSCTETAIDGRGGRACSNCQQYCPPPRICDPFQPCPPQLPCRQCPDGCEDGETISVCLPDAICGDGNIDPGEECDDGNDAPGDGCYGCANEHDAASSSSSPPPECSGFACALGARNSCLPDGCVDLNVQPCFECAPPLCGNHELDSGEECDDGNTKPNDGCDPYCRIEDDYCEYIPGSSSSASTASSQTGCNDAENNILIPGNADTCGGSFPVAAGFGVNEGTCGQSQQYLPCPPNMKCQNSAQGAACVAAPGENPISPQCTDTDEGFAIRSKGTTREMTNGQWVDVGTDSCIGSTRVHEQYCAGCSGWQCVNNNKSIATLVDCPTGTTCSDGACR